MINYLVYEELNIIKYVYHGSSIQNLKSFDVNKSITSHDFKTDHKLVKRIYAANSKQIAAAFTFQWNDSMGIKFGKWDNKPYLLEIPSKHSNLLNNKCSIYTLSSSGFIRNDSGIGLKDEYFSISKIKIIEEEQFNTCIEALNKYKCRYKII